MIASLCEHPNKRGKQFELVRLVAHFRLHCVDWPGDPEIEALAEHLKAPSTRFVALWAAKDVAQFVTTRRCFNRPDVGHLELNHHRLAVLGSGQGQL